MDAVKTGTTLKLEEVHFEDGGEKAYYDVCLSITNPPWHALTGLQHI